MNTKGTTTISNSKSNLETNQAVMMEVILVIPKCWFIRKTKVDEQLIKLKEQNVKEKYQPEAVRDQAVMLAAESEDRVRANSPILKTIQNAKTLKQMILKLF